MLEAHIAMGGDVEQVNGTVYEFALPQYANSGESYEWALQAWRRDAMRIAGGVTVMPMAEGSWRDPQDGRLYVDKMIGHRVMCGRDQADKLLAQAFKYFGDQKAIFVTEIGVGRIIGRPEDGNVAA